MACPNCPCPATCLAWPAFCEMAREEPPDEVKLRHICTRSARPPTPIAAAPGRPSAAEGVESVRRMKACPFRSDNPGCGCQGNGRCALRGGAVVSHRDCFSCLRRFPE